jgi:hypothetical protein
MRTPQPRAGAVFGTTAVSTSLRAGHHRTSPSWQNPWVPHPTRCLPALVCLLLLLTACRVDVTVGITVEENGSGDVTVTIEADPELVAAAPGLADDVRIDDLVAAGWRTDGATPAADGGLSLTLVRSFDTAEQATALLSSLNGPAGPLQAILIERDAALREVTFTVSGSGRVDGGLDAFADADLLAAVGGTPYAAQIAAAGGAPSDVLGVRVAIDLPGEVRTTSGATVTTVTTVTTAGAETGGSETADGDRASVAWDLALDGSSTAIEVTSVRSLERGGPWPWLANGLFALLVVWVLVSIVLIVLVLRSSRRRHRAADRLERVGRL